MAEEIVVENQRFEDLVVNRQYRPNAQIVTELNERTFPFNRNIFFGYNPVKLAADEFNRCVELYIQRGQNGTMEDTARLMGELIQMEGPHREELQDLAIDLVREMYNVPADFNIRALLEMPDQEDAQEKFADVQPPEIPTRAIDPEAKEEDETLTDERKAALQPAIEKRRILNTIVHGAAVHQWTSAFWMVEDKLNDINPGLIARYNKLSALVNFWNWSHHQGEMMNRGNVPMLQGYNEIDIPEKKIDAKGMNFPVLIHELSKAIIDLLVSRGIPTTFVFNGDVKNITGDDLKFIYAEADKYSHEQWHYCFGPSLWRAMLDTADVTSHDLPPILAEMSKLSYEDLAHFSINITFHPEELGKKEMELLKKQSA